MGRVKPAGRSTPTSKDVAALAGVAQSTVSVVMSGSRFVKPDTRRRVEDAMRELGYQPNAGARTLRTAQTRVIALAVHLGSEYDGADTVPYIDTIVEEARRNDYEVLLSTVREGPDGLTRLARRSVCDAFVLMDIQEHDDRLKAAAELGLPVVLMGQPSEDPGLDVAAFDWRQSARMLVDELALTGHRHITVLREPREGSFRFVNEFYDGARDRAAQYGIDFRSVACNDGWKGLQEVAPDLLAHRDDRLGLIVRTPRLTERLMQLLQVEQIVPGIDLSLVSACSDRVATGYDRPVTNVSAKPRELSALAMRLLFERLADPSLPPRLSVLGPNGLQRRATTVVYEGAVLHVPLASTPSGL